MAERNGSAVRELLWKVLSGVLFILMGLAVYAYTQDIRRLDDRIRATENSDEVCFRHISAMRLDMREVMTILKRMDQVERDSRALSHTMSYLAGHVAPPVAVTTDRLGNGG